MLGIAAADWAEAMRGLKTLKSQIMLNAFVELMIEQGSIRILNLLYEQHACMLCRRNRAILAVEGRLHANSLTSFPANDIYKGAAKCGHINIMNLAIIFGANNHEDAMIYAASHDKIEAMRQIYKIWMRKDYLLSIKPSLGIENSAMLAAGEGRTAVVSFYLEHSPFDDSAFHNVIMAAVTHGRLATVKYIIRKFPRETQNNTGEYFIQAAACHRLRVMKFLVSRVNSRTLHKAIIEATQRPCNKSMKIALWLRHTHGATIPQERLLELRTHQDFGEEFRQKWQTLLTDCASG